MKTDVQNPVKISLVTSSKGRLSYLKNSLKTWLKIDYSNFDIIIVDYDCPDGTEDYIKKNKAKFLKESQVSDIHIIKVQNKPVFNLCDARNTGIDFAKSELIFMIDADVHIKDKNILSDISEKYYQGIVFFSNVAVLSTNFIEGHVFYKAKYGIENIKCHALLPTHCKTVGLSGTACFIKEYYTICGKYRTEVNRSGWGSHDIEFYIRYLNFILIERFKKHEDKDNLVLDKIAKKISIFPEKIFVLKKNTIYEKVKFYENKKEVSTLINRNYIKILFTKKNIYLDWIYSNGFNNEKLIYILQYKRYKKYPIPKWFKFWYFYWIGLTLYNKGEYLESEKTFKVLLKNKDADINQIWQACFFIARIKKMSNKSGWSHYLNRGMEIVKKNKLVFEKDVERYYLASFFKFFRYYREAIKEFKELIQISDDNDLISGSYFHLGEIKIKKKHITSAKEMFKKSLFFNPAHRRADEYLKKL